MTKAAKSKESTVELRAQAIECRMVGDNLTMKAVNFKAVRGGDISVPRLVMCFDPGIKQIEAMDMLQAVIDRIAWDSLPPLKVTVPSAIMDLIKRRKATRQSILARLSGLPDHVRDCVLTYMDERLVAISSGEV